MGRPRAFNVDQALERAMRVFWRKGYESASLSDLTRAMGINPPSLYAAFGSKEALFRHALDRYAAGPASYVTRALEAPTARAVAEQLLRGAAALQFVPGNPKGCLMVQGTHPGGQAADSVRRHLQLRRAAEEVALRQRFERAKFDGDLPADADAAALARYLATMMDGMAVRASVGASAKALHDVIEIALRAWPRAAIREPSRTARGRRKPNDRAV